MGVEPDLEGEVAFPASLGGQAVVEVALDSYATASATALVVPEGVAGASLDLDEGVKDLTLPASLREGSISFRGDTVRVPSLDGWIHRTFSFKTWGSYCYGGDYEGYDLHAAGRIVRAVTIPGSMRKVPEGLFRTCRSIQSVTFGAGIERIGEGAFFSCGGLQHADFPVSLRVVKEDAFYGCTNLVFTLPSLLDEIGGDAFDGTQTYAEAVAAAKEKGEVAYLGNWAIGWPYVIWEDNEEGVPCPESVVIREGTRGIMADAFYGWASLKQVTLPKSLKVVGAWAFEDTSLERVALPDGLKRIDKKAFYSPTLSALPTFPASLEGVGKDAFGRFGDSDDEEDDLLTPTWYARHANGWIVADGWLLGYKNANYVWDEEAGNWREDEANPPPAPPWTLTVPATVKHIAGFTWPEGVDEEEAEEPQHELVLPNRLETISAEAFCGLWTGALTIPASVKRIGGGAFCYVDGPIAFLGRPPTVWAVDAEDMPFEDASIGYFAAGTPGWTDGMTYAGLKMRACSSVGGRLVPHVAVSLDIGGAGTVSGLGKASYAAGTKLNLRAAAKRGHVFAGWSLEGVAFPENRNPLDPTLPLVVGEEAIMVSASFIPVEEDWVAFTNDDFADEYETGGAFEPITLEVESASLASVKVTGLPTGLKFAAKPVSVRVMPVSSVTYPANTVYGAPTKSGVYTVVATATTAGRTTAVKSWTVVVRKEGENFLKAECDPAMGRVTGGGIYADGKKATLRATPNGGFVFAGWHDADGEPLEGDVDFRSPSFPYTAAGEDVAVWAEFIPAEDDTEPELDVDDVYNASGAFDLTLKIESRSLPKVTLSGLPSGLKFDKKTNRISGTAKKPGTYTVTAKLANASVRKAVVQTFTIVVDNLTGANDLLLVRDAGGDEAALLNARGKCYEISAGVREFDLPALTARNEGDRLALSGLPAGLKYDAKTGRIGGVATKAGVYTVQAKVSSGRASYVSTFTVEVKALPAWAVGTFTGSGDCPIPPEPEFSDNLYGTVTVGANGRLSGKVVYDNADERLFTAILSAPALTGYDAGEGCYYFDVEMTFRNGRENPENKVLAGGSPRRLYIYPGDYDEEGRLTVGRVSVEDGDGFRLDLVQNVRKLKGFADLPAFAAKEVVVSTTQEIWGDPEAEGTSTLTLALKKDGTVAVTFVDEGIDFINQATGVGEPFVEKVVTKAEFLVTRHLSDPDCYVALVPIVIPRNCTLRAVVELRVSPDGLIRSEDCAITECTDFDDWTDYYPDDD